MVRDDQNEKKWTRTRCPGTRWFWRERGVMVRDGLAWFNLAPIMSCGKSMPGKYLHVFPRWVTPLLTCETATWLLCDGGIATSGARCFTCAPRDVSSPGNQSWREPHVCHKDVAIYCADLIRMSSSLFLSSSLWIMALPQLLRINCQALEWYLQWNEFFAKQGLKETRGIYKFGAETSWCPNV